MVSQRQIAKMLNMTQQAVSAALRPVGDMETSRVAPETRKLVLETAERLGYRANRYASVLKSGRSGMIGILSGSFAYHWVGERTNLVSREIMERSYIPWPFDVCNNLQRKGEIIDILIDSKLDGVILTWGVDPSIYKSLKKAGIPMVSYEGDRFDGVPWVGPDKARGYHDLVIHLLNEGCRNILLARPQTRRDYLNRPGQEVEIEALTGYLSGMKSAGKQTAKEPLVFLPDGSPPYGMSGMMEDYEVGYQLMKVALPRKPDALLFPNDSMALGGLCACRDAGLRVPQDICITGLNDEPQSLFSWIPLTTIRQPLSMMASQAVSVLLERIQKRTVAEPPRSQCDVIVRQSSCRISTPPDGQLAPSPDLQVAHP